MERFLKVFFWVVLGIAGVAVVGIIGFYAIYRINYGRRHPVPSGEVMARSLASAVENFYGEYNRLPDVGGRRVVTAYGGGLDLLRILLALEKRGGQNDRSVIFLQGKEAKDQRGGIDYGDGDTVEGVYDAFGNPYTVILNADYEDELVFQWGGREVRLRGKQVAVWSVGKDGIEGTEDDARSWN